ncbi:tyrosine-type recombinase/integrase [Hyunsoonleella sp. 2307UL5-6]|uniref:tyrosine-type recombinase/integrase n=1 Tax=Hyunsoonleella sp. 2307UL5-6 TaxID=3384768 RepID=UPI0039BC3A96
MTITLAPSLHRNQAIIKIDFKYNTEVKNYINAIEGVYWSKTHNSFYIVNSSINKRKIYKAFRLKKWYVDYSAFPKKTNTIPKVKNIDVIIKLPVLIESSQKELEKFKRWMQQKRLSTNTVNTYFEVTAFFLRYAQLKQKTISTKLIEQFNYDFIVRPNKSISYQNQCISGIKKYLDYKNMEVLDIDLERPKKPKKLPEVLSEDEIKHVLQHITNLKHKTLIALIYSAGLRIGEALKLRVKDIDSNRMVIHIKSAKGKKDRYTLLSPKFLELLREYYKTYQPKTYLFEGQSGGLYTSSSAQNILKKATYKAKITKPITLHTLRHSFATHLLENGTDIRYIQTLLGHSSPNTTMIYTHVSQTSIRNIKNPFDNL